MKTKLFRCLILSTIRTLSVLAFILVFSCVYANAQTLSILHAFASPPASPSAALVQGKDGNFYGTTQGGGTHNEGTVFKITQDGTLTILASFNDTTGASPHAGLLLGTDGNYYGTTQRSGANDEGTVFKMTPDGTLTAMASFDGANGAHPAADLVLGSDGNYYGTTQNGGASNNGTVFKMSPDGMVTALVSFNGTNGSSPSAALVQARDGNFYGTTANGGGTNGYGTVFRMGMDGALTTLVSFNGTNGSHPQAPLIQGNDGSLYGTTGGAARTVTARCLR